MQDESLFSDPIINWFVLSLPQDHHDELSEILDRKKKETLAHKRSFFVRMVSDPKIYNPNISKAGPPRLSHEIQTPTADGVPMIQTPTTAR